MGMTTRPSYIYQTAYLDTNTVVFKNIGKLANTGVDMITNISVKVEGLGGPLTSATVNFTGQPHQNLLTSLSPNQEVIFDLSLNATGPLRGTIAIVFTSTGGTTTLMRVIVALNIRKPVLNLDPPSWSGSVVRGTQKNFEMKITNLGEVAATDVRLALSNDKRLSVVSFSVVGTPTASDNMIINPNETAVLSVTVTTAKDEPLGEMRGRFGLNTKTTSKYIYYHFFITSIQIMNLSVRVEDEYTYFAPGKPLLAGATVKLSNPRRRYSMELLTTNDTEVTFEDIYEDRYNLHVSAPSHSSYQAVIITKFDKNITTVFLERIAVTYTWTVTPTTIQDKYVITMESTFETQVPMPVVTIKPAKVNTIPYEEGRLDRMEFEITNHGLIRADNLRFSLPNHPYLIFTQTIPNIGSLAANGSMIVPLSVKLKSRKRRNAAAAAFCGLMLLYDFNCGGTRTKGLDVTMTRETPGRPPMPCGLTSSGGGGSTRGPYTGVSGIGGTSATGSGSAVSYNPVTPMSCDCAKTLIQTCTLSFHPIVGCAFATADLAMSDSFFGFLSNALNFAFSCIIGVFCTLCGYAWTIANCIWEASDTCASGSRRRRDVSSALIDQMFEAARPMNNYLSILTEVFGDDRMHNIDEYDWYQKFKSVISDNSEQGVVLTTSEVMQVLATVNKTTNKEIVQKFLHRWNNTASALNNGTLGSADTSKNIMSKTLLDPKFEKFVSDTEASKKKGYDSIFDFFDHSLNAYKANEKLQSKEDGVCAKVRVRIVQELVLTRDAFNAKLEIENGEESDLEDIKVTIDIRQTYGSGDPALVGITGVDGSGRLRRSVSGTAEWLIVPYSTAAIKDDTLYDVGGRLTYRVGSSNFSLSLLPDTITVKPNPSLIVHYFHEKYVQGDDPMTQNIVEPIVPFSLSVMVANTGYGVARAMKITSAQPEIIENEKGLLISFRIIGAQLGKDPITPSLTVTFGDIDPFETKNARWLLTSTLKGTFYNYSATFENINPLGDPQLSLLDDLGYHELLHLVRIEGDSDDGLDDYLVNDVIDETDMPDRLYDSSNGTIYYNVSVTNVTHFRQHSFEQRGHKNYTYIRLLTEVKQEGWFYLRVINNITKTPILSGPKLLSVVNIRENGDQINVLVGKNAWITTHIGDEYYFHLLDKNQNKSANMSYELIFGPVNMYAPRFDKDVYTVYTDLMSSIGSVILTINASDVDRDNITYLIQGSAGYFNLNSNTGTLTLAKVFSAVTKMKFNITAVDNGIPSKSTNVSVILNIFSSNQSTTTTSSTTRVISDKTDISSTSTTSKESSTMPTITNRTTVTSFNGTDSTSPDTVSQGVSSTLPITMTQGELSTSPSTVTQGELSTSPSSVTQGKSSTVSTSTTSNRTSASNGTTQTVTYTQTDESTSTLTSTDYNITEMANTTELAITTGKLMMGNIPCQLAINFFNIA
ncbi:hypothetical protein KUTeg_010655 [Tegillarca granosa]|uniref:Cadherin domain-containing protein n=1 Tax=Tegillarca granosa TaxID=220873 RepID=A0ABQ9F6A8_TEGGR|nr:hypothetical protein KUTeg_010655 [Tegillarca granosa]